MNTSHETKDLLVFSHLRWSDRNNELHNPLALKARHRRVFYFEKPLFQKMAILPHLEIKESPENIFVITPYLPEQIDPAQTTAALTDLVDELLFDENIHDYTAWYYDPEALSFTRHLHSQGVIFEKTCSLSYQYEVEDELIKKADLVLTTEQNFYEQRKSFHHNIHLLSEMMDTEVLERISELELMITRPRPRKENLKIIPV